MNSLSTDIAAETPLPGIIFVRDASHDRQRSGFELVLTPDVAQGLLTRLVKVAEVVPDLKDTVEALIHDLKRPSATLPIEMRGVVVPRRLRWHREHFHVLTTDVNRVLALGLACVLYAPCDWADTLLAELSLKLPFAWARTINDDSAVVEVQVFKLAIRVYVTTEGMFTL